MWPFFGRDSPIFNVHKDGTGCIFAIGWSGQWNACLERNADSLTFRSKIEDTEFFLFGGEKIRTSSVVMMPYEGSYIDSQNKWKRLIKEEFSLIGKPGRDDFAPLCAGVWGGMNAESILKLIDTIKKNHLQFEYIWIDAGWYGQDTAPSSDEFEGDWWSHTGDWVVSKKIFPKGLEEISKATHNAGMKFILWLEPERAFHTANILSEHPEFYLGRTRKVL